MGNRLMELQSFDRKYLLHISVLTFADLDTFPRENSAAVV